MLITLQLPNDFYTGNKTNKANNEYSPVMPLLQFIKL